MPSATRAAGRMASSLSDFGLDLHRRLPSNANTLISPVSLGTALAALLRGARGQTARQIAGVLRLRPGGGVGAGMSDLLHVLRPRTAEKRAWSAERGTMERVDEDLFRLALATALFVQERYPLHAGFPRELDDVYDAELFSVSFDDAPAAAARINSWVAERTEGHITELMNPWSVGPGTRLVLANAVYLNARWAEPFAGGLQSRRPFFLESGEEVRVPTMTSDVARPYWIDRDLGAQAVRLRYSATAEMIVVVPDRGRRTYVEAMLSNSLLDEIVRTSRDVDLELSMPRFEHRFTLDAAPLLREMGIVEAFSPHADFAGVSPDPAGLVLADVAHEAWIRVDEERTKAAAATGVSLSWSVPDDREAAVVLHIRRPFLFFVRDTETGAILFQGRVMDPR